MGESPQELPIGEKRQEQVQAQAVRESPRFYSAAQFKGTKKTESTLIVGLTRFVWKQVKGWQEREIGRQKGLMGSCTYTAIKSSTSSAGMASEPWSCFHTPVSEVSLDELLVGPHLTGNQHSP